MEDVSRSWTIDNKCNKHMCRMLILAGVSLQLNKADALPGVSLMICSKANGPKS